MFKGTTRLIVLHDLTDIHIIIWPEFFFLI